MMIPEISKRS